MSGDSEETTVDLIPGIGIIRARSLKKAGWPTVASLRSASTDDLLAIPGITEIKAAQILDYIRSLSQEPPVDAPVESTAPVTTAVTIPDAAPLPVAPPTDTIAITFTAPLPDEVQVPVYALQSPRDLMQDVALSAQLLLTSEFAGKWEQPFAQQLAKLISLHQKWDRYEPLGKKQSKQVMELLGKVYRLLTETPVSEMTKRKSQERLAEVLRDRRRKIRDLLGG